MAFGYYGSRYDTSSQSNWGQPQPRERREDALIEELRAIKAQNAQLIKAVDRVERGIFSFKQHKVKCMTTRLQTRNKTVGGKNDQI